MLLILSPSKTQHFDVPVRSDCTLPIFTEQANQLVRLLKQFDRPQLATLMKMSYKLAELTWQRFQDYQPTSTPDNSRQALFMFQGDQFNPMDVNSYSQEQLQHAQQHLRILSGLYGILRPLDLIQPYRLEMATKLAVANARNLYHFWDDLITEALNDALQSDPQPLLINMASAEYFKVIRKKELQAKILTLSFKQEKAGTVKTIAIYAKRARGAMADFVIQNCIVKPKDLQAFCADGYCFRPDISTGNTEWVFVKKL